MSFTPANSSYLTQVFSARARKISCKLCQCMDCVGEHNSSFSSDIGFANDDVMETSKIRSVYAS